MRPIIDQWNIVLVGAWNRKIFTPPWLHQHLRFSDGEQLEITFEMQPDLPVIYRTRDLVLKLQADRLIVGPRRIDDECLLKMEQFACSLLDKLPHTPLVAIGINFDFKEENPPNTATQLFTQSDIVDLGADGWTVEGQKLARSLKKNSIDYNIGLELKNGILTINNNFHAQVTTADAAVAKIRGSILLHRSTAISILSSVYHLTQEANA